MLCNVSDNCVCVLIEQAVKNKRCFLTLLFWDSFDGWDHSPVYSAYRVRQQCKIQDPSFLICRTSSKLYRNRKQNFQVLKPNVNCVTLAAGCSTPQVHNINWVVPPAGYIPQKWGGDMSLPAPKVAPPMLASCSNRTRANHPIIVR